MSIQSMTGFARAAGEMNGATFVWELKSVNGKSLDVRLRLPPGFERLEPAVRQAISRKFTRGSVQAVLSVTQRAVSSAAPVVNEALLKELAALAQRLTNEFGAAPASADGLLALRGVLDFPEGAETEDGRAEGDRAALGVLEEALAALEGVRQSEGRALGEILVRQLHAMEELTLRAETDPSREPSAIREKLAAQLRLLLDAQPALDEGRFAAEAALLATRADIREEIDRLKTHCAAAHAILAQGGAVGRRLDFLGQELNREANTLCSKSGAATVTAAGLELKAVVDQFREQVQNLE